MIQLQLLHFPRIGLARSSALQCVFDFATYRPRECHSGKQTCESRWILKLKCTLHAAQRAFPRGRENNDT